MRTTVYKPILLAAAVLTATITSIVHLSSPKEESINQRATQTLQTQGTRASQSISSTPIESPISIPATQPLPYPHQMPTSQSVDDFIRRVRLQSSEMIKDELQEVQDRIASEQWIERANSAQLDDKDRVELEEILNKESALKLVLLEREVTRLKGKYL
jgi:hypothetical protein